MATEVGGDRVGIEISPEMNFNDIVESGPLRPLRDGERRAIH
jgi:hypothetical protein